MIALGGTIGTGLFLTTGQTIATAGPGGALLAYTLIGVMVYFLMTGLGEMSSYMPVSGSFATFSGKYVDKSLGFATGWNIWYNWAVTLAFEMSAAAAIMNYWLPDVPGWVFSLVFIILIACVNIVSVKVYGEVEFWASSIKIFVVIVFLIIGVLMIFGIIGSHNSGFSNWIINEAPFANGVGGIVSVFLVAGFAFQGTENIGVAAGETKNPSEDIPKATKRIFWRIIVFYIMAVFVIGTIIPYTNPDLFIDDVAVSPFTLVFENIGIIAAASVMNAIILTAVLSAGNGGCYVSTRMLYSLSKEGHAPKIFSRTNSRGVPIYALFATIAVGCLALLSGFFGDGVVYSWLLNISSVSGFICWIVIAITHYRFRRGFIKNGNSLNKLHYKAPLFPLGSLLALFACIFVVIGQNFVAFTDNGVDFWQIAELSAGVPVFLAFFIGYKIKYRSKLIKYEDMTF